MGRGLENSSLKSLSSSSKKLGLVNEKEFTMDVDSLGLNAVPFCRSESGLRVGRGLELFTEVAFCILNNWKQRYALLG